MLAVDFKMFISALQRYVGTVENLEAVVDGNPELKKNKFAILEAREQAEAHAARRHGTLDAAHVADRRGLVTPSSAIS